ncbi:MAG: lipopolysaccharide biosynthesis protein [Pleurocapsa sp. MO_226.B13]|nr:lipopolysaccharide biosynthesis protein [Pleurocapsa sp. MO_226.B13]
MSFVNSIYQKISHLKKSKVVKDSLWATFTYGFNRFSKLISQIVLARLLAPEDFGVWGMLMLVMNLAQIFNESSIASVLIQRGLDDKKLVNTVYSLGLDVSISLFVFQSLAAFPLSNFFNEPILIPLTIATASIFLIRAGAGSHGAVLTQRMKFRELTICRTSSSFVGVFVSCFLAFAGFNIWALALGEIAAMSVESILLHRLSQYKFNYQLLLDINDIKEVIGYISSLIGINFAVYVNTNSDNLIVGKILGTSQLGYYNLAYQLSMVPTYTLSRINEVNFTVLSKKNRNEQQKYVQKILKAYAKIAAPIFSLGFVVAPWLIPLIYGSKWSSTVPLFQIVLLFAYTRGLMSILGTTLNAINYPHINALINWVLIPLSIPTFFIGSWLGGVVGVATAVSIMMGIGATIWFWLATCKVSKWKPYALAQPIILPTASCIFLLLSIHFFPISETIKQIIAPFYIIVFYGGILFLSTSNFLVNKK